MVLEEALKHGKKEKVVVLVGSLVPLGEPSSDAVDNLAVAVQCLKSQKVGKQDFASFCWGSDNQILIANKGWSLDGDEWKTLEGG